MVSDLLEPTGAREVTAPSGRRRRPHAVANERNILEVDRLRALDVEREIVRLEAELADALKVVPPVALGNIGVEGPADDLSVESEDWPDEALLEGARARVRRLADVRRGKPGCTWSTRTETVRTSDALSYESASVVIVSVGSVPVSAGGSTENR